MKQFIVITTIHPKSEAIRAWEHKEGWQLVLVGDKKSVPLSGSAATTFLSLEEQRRLPFRLARRCPLNHYSRKNIGYLYALAQGAHVLCDTDDDNIPLERWAAPPFACRRRLRAAAKFVNIYRPFTAEPVWPRGFPPDEILRSRSATLAMSEGEKADIAVWQGLSDDEPDVDALFRLVLNRRIRFTAGKSFYLAPGQFTPVNSQNSLWQRRAFPYLYLPATVSFRFTDILRGYIAQRLLWQDGLHVGVTQATVRQRRNPHDIMADFADEMPVYLQVKKMVERIESVPLGADPWENLFALYESLVAAGFVARREMGLLALWREAFLQLEGQRRWTKRNS